MKLELSFPTKPYIITQAFGIYNPAYLQFGFDHHNGIDFLPLKPYEVSAMCEGEVYETGFNSGAGNFVRYKTKEPVDVNGHKSYVGFMYMHAEKILVKVGDKVKCGDSLIVADNTGFSTGLHTHISAYFINEDNTKQSFGDKSTDYCFDFSEFYNGLYATDVKIWWQKLSTALNLLKKLLGYN
jgi:murein DD-endopeptidase MepM/ murein hydrolase activator NlpD